MQLLFFTEGKSILFPDLLPFIFKLYTDRLPTYREVSDYEVRNDGELSQAVNMLDSIIELLKGGYRVA